MDAAKAVDAASSVANHALDVAGPVAEKFSENAGKALAMLMDKVASGIDSATSFLAAQIPDVIRQLLVYKLTMSLLGFLLGVVMVVVTPFAIRWCFVKTRNLYDKKRTYGFDQQDYALVLIVFGCAPIMAGGIAIIFCHLDWIEIWLAPKIYLIQYAAELVKSFSGK
jgi:hypothetical protein